MRYDTFVFDTQELLRDAPRERLEALGSACEVGTARAGALFVSAAPEAVDAAFASGFSCALALWRGVPARHARAAHYLRAPYELVELLTRREDVYDGLAWMQTAVEMQFIAQAGLHYRDMEQAGVWLPLKSLTCRFIHGAKYEDVVTVTTKVTNLTPARVEFSYQVENQDGVLLATGSTLHGFTTPQLKPISLKKHFPQFWEVIEKAAGLTSQ